MISPLAPRQAAELLLAASLRTGGMTQTEWLATLGGPGSGNFGHAGRPGEVGGSAPEGGAVDDIKEDAATGAAPDKDLVWQSARGISDCERLLEGVVASADFGATVKPTGDWNDVDQGIRDEVEAAIRDDYLEQLNEYEALDKSGIDAAYKEYLRDEPSAVIDRAVEGIVSAYYLEPPHLSAEAIKDSLIVYGNAAPRVDLEADIQFEDGTPLTADQKRDLSDTFNSAYTETEGEFFDNRTDDPWYEEAVADAEKEWLTDRMNEVDDIQRFDKAHAMGYDDEALYGVQMEPGVPTQWVTGTHNIETPEDQENYDRTAAIVREMAFQRSQEIAEERGIKPPTKEDIKDIWYSWKGSSQGMKAREFQQAVADELGGVTRFTDLQANDLRNRSDFDRMKAYVRGQWETNQWLMSKAGEDYIDVYRGVIIPTEDIERAGVTMHIFGNNDYGELPSVSLKRNGAQSTTSDPDVANAWRGVGTTLTVPSERVVLRIRAPRTSVISLPVYGDNVHNESETVLAGTRDRWWWDLWRSRAPEFNVHPPKPVHRAAALGPNGEIVIDFFEIDQQYTEHWLSRKERRLGGPGSGNFGHSGRPGEVGGSGDGGGESGDDRSDALKAWFGDSKVVDSSGKPLVVYHRGSFDEGDEVPLSVGAEGMHFGTKDAADSRPAGKVVDDLIKSITVDQDEETGKWFWSMDGVDSYEIDEEGFDSEADARESAEREAVTIGDNSEWEEDDIPLTAAYLKIVNPMRTSDQGADWSKAVALAKSKGHDGIVYRNQFEDKGRDSYIVFSPSQVKSVNSKRFDPNSDLITAGGKGSGNFGHAGRKGEVGGSAPGEGGGEPIEESVIHHVVGSWQESTEVVREFREMSIGETEESEEFKTFKKVMAALPREKRDTYRGFQALDLSQFEEGAEIDLNAFASSSRDYKGAEFYARRDMDDLEKEVLFNNEPTSPVIMVFKGGAQFKARLPDVADAGFMKEVVIAPSKWVIKTAHDVFPSGKQLREVILVPR